MSLPISRIHKQSNYTTYLLLRSKYSTHKLNRELSNSQASKLLKELYTPTENNSASTTAQQALDIYHCIYEPKSKYVINPLLKVLFNCKQSHQIQNIWQDIEQVNDIGYILLLKTCVQSNPINIDHCIQVLKWIKQTNYKIPQYEIADFSINVSKLISICYKCPEKLKQIYSLIKHTDDIFIKTALINALGKIHKIPSAEKIFNSITDKQRNIISINAMITALVNNEQYDNALELYDKYNKLSDNTSHLLALKACINSDNYMKGKDIHHNIYNSELSVELQNTLIEFYGTFGDMVNAFEIFYKMDENKRDVYAVSNIMKAMISNGLNSEALRLYDEYELKNDNVSHIHALQACINTNDMIKGTQIHKNIFQSKYKASVEVLNTLINFYGHFGDIFEAIKIFKFIDESKGKNSVSYGVMMNAFIDNNMNKEALILYDKIGILSNNVTDLLAIKACINTNKYNKGYGILMQYENNNHGKEFTFELQCVAINFYSHFGDIINAKRLCESIDFKKCKEELSVGFMMKAYSNNNLDEKALEIYDKFKHLHNDIIYLQAINSCIKSQNFEKGKEIYEIVKYS
eukprot:517402_1